MGHIHDKIDFIVVAYIVHRDRVLLVHHKLVGHWVAVGGHVELDEDPEQALIREVEEETGLTPDEVEVASSKPTFVSPGFKPLFTPNFLDIHAMPGNHQHIGLIYLLRSQSDTVTREESAHDEIRWFTQEELGEPSYDIMTGNQYYATEALKMTQDPQTTWQPLATVSS